MTWRGAVIVMLIVMTASNVGLGIASAINEHYGVAAFNLAAAALELQATSMAWRRE